MARRPRRRSSCRSRSTSSCQQSADSRSRMLDAAPPRRSRDQAERRAIGRSRRAAPSRASVRARCRPSPRRRARPSRPAAACSRSSVWRRGRAARSGVDQAACTGSAPGAASPRRAPGSGRARTGCRRRGSAGGRGCGGCATSSLVGSSVTALDRLVATAPRRRPMRRPRPWRSARASGRSEMRQKPPGMTFQPSGVAAAKTRSTKGRGSRRPVAPDRHGREPHDLLPDEVDGRVARSPRSSAVALLGATGPAEHAAAGRRSPARGAAEGRRDRHARRARRATMSRSAGWPHHQVAMLGSVRSSPSRRAAERRQEAEQRARFEHARARHVGDRPRRRARIASSRPGTPRREAAVQLQRVDEVGVDPPPDHVGALQAGDGAHIDARRRAPRGRRPRPAGSRDSGRDGLLEIGLAERARRQQADARLARARPRRPGRRGSRWKKGASRCDVHARCSRSGKARRQHQPVLQRVARARRRLRAVVQHPPAPVRARGRDRRRRAAGSARRAASTPRIGRRKSGLPVDARRPAARRRDQTRRRRRCRAAAPRSGRRAGRRRRRSCAHSSSPISSGRGLSGQVRSLLLAVDAVGDAGVADVPVGEREAARRLVLRRRRPSRLEQAAASAAAAGRPASISSSGTPGSGR